ncbi:MAG: hypothetical protein GY771_12100, partial [bacterium]|nr:hypothetical protein [bacterium]
MDDTVGKKLKDSPLILILTITAGVTAFITIIIALGGVAATVFIPEGLGAFLLAIIASVLCLVGGLAVVLIIVIIAAFTKHDIVRVYSITLSALFLVVALLINLSAYGWFFFDPAKRAEYEAEEKTYSDGIGRLFEDQLDGQTETGFTASGYFEWLMESDFGYKYYNIEGTKKSVPMYIYASTYDEEPWTIQISPNIPIPDISE